MASAALKRTAPCAIFNYREVKVDKAIIEHSRQVWLAADITKFNRPAMVELAHLSHIDRLFTDAPPPDSFVQLLEQSGVECSIAVESAGAPALSLVS